MSCSSVLCCYGEMLVEQGKSEMQYKEREKEKKGGGCRCVERTVAGAGGKGQAGWANGNEDKGGCEMTSRDRRPMRSIWYKRQQEGGRVMGG